MSSNQKKNYLTFDKLDLLSPQGILLKKGLSFRIDEGDLLVLHGENGRGKSTLAKYIYQQLLKFKIAVGYLPQLSNIYSSLPFTLREVVELYNVLPSNYQGQLLTAELLKKSWNHCSGGEKRRALLEQAILKKPDVLILDEPFNHLDQQGIEDVEGELQRLMIQGQVKTIILASHCPLAFDFGADQNICLKDIVL